MLVGRVSTVGQNPVKKEDQRTIMFVIPLYRKKRDSGVLV